MIVDAIRNEITGEWMPISPVEVVDESDAEWVAQSWNDNVLDIAFRIQIASLNSNTETT